MPHAIRIHETGGPEILRCGENRGCNRDLAQAHRDQKARNTTGSMVLLP